MKFTEIKQYEAWLKTNPAISEILKFQKSLLKVVVASCKKIIRFCKRKKSRSCIWIKEPVSGKPQGIKSTAFPAEWGDQPDENYQYRCQRMYENLNREIAMEQLFYQGLQILKN